jgi:hypothetical protein
VGNFAASRIRFAQKPQPAQNPYQIVGRNRSKIACSKVQIERLTKNCLD